MSSRKSLNKRQQQQPQQKSATTMWMGGIWIDTLYDLKYLDHNLQNQKTCTKQENMVRMLEEKNQAIEWKGPQGSPDIGVTRKNYQHF